MRWHEHGRRGSHFPPFAVGRRCPHAAVPCVLPRRGEGDRPQVPRVIAVVSKLLVGMLSRRARG